MKKPAYLTAFLILAVALPARADRKPKKQPAPEKPDAAETPPDDAAPEGDGEAEKAPADSADTPWAKGVSAGDRAKAQQLLETGNNLFLESKYPEALAKYREAIKSWDHPAIRFNIVRVLIKLDRPIEAYDNLEAALRFGPAPLEEQVFQEAQNYKTLLLGQIGNVEVKCSQEGVNITIDGEEFLSCPGKKTKRMSPGNHSIVGKKKNYLTLSRKVVLLPGKKEVVDAKLVSLDDATVTERRWAVWKPWTVTGGGVALAGIGLLLQLKAKSDFDQYGSEITNLCGESGCLPEDIPGSTKGLKSQAHLENGIAIGTMIAGGAVVAGGITMVLLNRPHAVIPDETPPPSSPQVTPEVSAHGFGLLVSQRF